MRKIFIGFSIVLLAAVWMSGSWVFFNSTALGAEGCGCPAGIEQGGFGHHHGGPWMHHHRFWKMLDLTDTQKKEMFSIKLDERAKMKPLIQSLKAGREQLVTLVLSGKFDEAKAHAIAKEQASTIENLIVAKARMHARLFSVLTPEQRAKLEKLRQEWKSNHEKEHEQKA